LLESNIVNSILLPLSLVNTTEHTHSYLASHNFIIRLFIFFSNFIASQYSSSLTSPFHFTITYIIFYCRKFIRIALLSISLNLSKSLFYILTKLIFSLVKYRFLYFSGNFFSTSICNSTLKFCSQLKTHLNLVIGFIQRIFLLSDI
jgi:hypothetical protein